MSVENLSPAAYRIFIKTLLRKQALSLSECTPSITRTFPRFKLHLGASCPNSACFISPHVAFSRIFATFSTRKNIPSSLAASLAHASIFFQPLHQPSAPFMPRSYRLPAFLYKFIQHVYYSPAFLHKSHAKSLIQPKREPAPARPREAPPTQAACMRGVRGPARRMESSPAPGSLWFLSPAGKELVRPQTHETPSSRKNNPARVPPPKTKEKRPAHPDRSS